MIINSKQISFLLFAIVAMLSFTNDVLAFNGPDKQINLIKKYNASEKSWIMHFNEPFQIKRKIRKRLVQGEVKKIRLYSFEKPQAFYNPKTHIFVLAGENIFVNFDHGIIQELNDERDKRDKTVVEVIFIGPWLYYPKVGNYNRYVGVSRIFHTDSKKISQQEEIFEPLTGFLREAKDKAKSSTGQKAVKFFFESFNHERNQIKEKPITKYQEGMYYSEWWSILYGINCYFDILGNQEIKCYNELEIPEYNRFIFTGNLAKEQNEFYVEGYKLVEPIWIGDIDKHDKNKNTLENLLLYKVANIKNGIANIHNPKINYKNSDKILIMVPKEQATTFIATIKKLPDNIITNLRGYVWFMSSPRKDEPEEFKPYNFKKYDVLPNDKYDAELARISNGNLKAKYGRYLTKERYSEDYVAPSIYNNNYNDKPEW